MPPLQFVAPTEGVVCSGSPDGSSATSGIALASSRACCSGVNAEYTAITPNGWRASNCSAHERPDDVGSTTSVNATASSCSRATGSTPRMISIAMCRSSP
jgi:hypothetical protein